MQIIRIVLLIVGLIALEGTALAQHPIDIQKQVLEGSYYEALLTYEKMPKRRADADAQIAVGKAAWALGLNGRAIEEFEKALSNPKITPDKRARLMLSRGIIEFQEQREQVAMIYAEKVLREPKADAIVRAKANLLWGESLYAIGSYSQAVEKYEQALTSVPESLKAENHFLLGKALARLGKREEALEEFEQVPLSHERTPESIRALAALSLDLGDYKQTQFWLGKAREQYPDQFIDSWVDYALVTAALKTNDLKLARQQVKEALQKFPPSDHWLTLMQAGLEVEEWKARLKTPEVIK